MISYEQAIENYINVKPLQKSEENITLYCATYKETGHKVLLKESPVRNKALYEGLLRQKHRNVCVIYQITEIQKSSVEGIQELLLVEMEFIRGETLAEYIRKNGVLNTEEAVDLSIQICDGLEFLHHHGMIHRDLSPHNILITKEGNVKIIDFDSSILSAQAKKSANTVYYTYGCTAGEVTTGKKVDKRADIYSLGRVVNFMLTGSTLGNDFKPKLKPSQIRLSQIITKCSKEQAKDRYKSVDLVKKKLKKVCSKNNVISKRKANIKLTVGVIGAFALSLLVFIMIYYTPAPDYSDKYSKLAQISDRWNYIYYDMDVAKDYDDAIEKLEEIIAEGDGTENVYIQYAKCLIGKENYDSAAEALITYLREEYKYPNLTSEMRDSYVLLTSLESQVSKEELTKIEQAKSNASEYIDIWKNAADKFRKKDFDGAIKLVDELLKFGARIDVTYFLKIECLLGKNDRRRAKEVYNEYIENKEQLEGNEIVDYNTIDYMYKDELYEKIR